jgi:hypothetical protein
MKRTSKHRTAGPAPKIAVLVRRAQGMASAFVLTEGVGDSDTTGFTVEGVVEDLIGHHGPDDLNDTQMSAYTEALEAAYAFGIAVGLLLRPELFAKGGAR